jgi:hypothetical protein
MRDRIPILGIPLAAALMAASVVGMRFAARSDLHASSSGGAVTRSVRGATAIEALDYSIQERFRNLSGFGMARMPVTPQHVDRFDPETSDEKAAVAGLRDRGWTVGLYLGGRGLLDPPMTESEWTGDGPYSFRKAISEPIIIVGDITPEDLPRPWELQAIGRRALEASTATDRYEDSFGRWSVDARAVRANQVACLKCHTAGRANDFRSRDTDPGATLRLGDALGVAIYVYARTQE